MACGLHLTHRWGLLVPDVLFQMLLVGTSQCSRPFWLEVITVSWYKYGVWHIYIYILYIQIRPSFCKRTSLGQVLWLGPNFSQPKMDGNSTSVNPKSPKSHKSQEPLFLLDLVSAKILDSHPCEEVICSSINLWFDITAILKKRAKLFPNQ